MTPLRVLVTGSRNWTDEPHRTIANDIGRICEAAERAGREVVLVHGGARGADTIAEWCALHEGATIEEHPADWAKYEKRAGTPRNAAMVALGADLCLAYPLPDSRGTWDCVRRARAAGIPTLVRSPLTGDNLGARLSPPTRSQP